MKICVHCKTRFESEGWRCPVCHFTPEQRNGYRSFAPELARANSHYDPDFFARLISVEAGHFWFEARTQILTWVLRRYAPKADNFLELGCGTGFVLAKLRSAFPSLALSGGELLFNGLAYTQDRVPTATLFQMDARRIPFECEFDVIGAFDVLEHIEEDKTVIQQMYTAVKPGGIILLTVPQHRFLWSVIDEQSYHQRRYTRKELVEKVEQAGFEPLYTTSFVTLLLPLMLLSRLKYRFYTPRSRAHLDLLKEFQINGVLNRLMKKVMMLELALIRSGLSLPLGGSLLLVARKPSESVALPEAADTALESASTSRAVGIES